MLVASLLDEQARALVLGASVAEPLDRGHLLTALAQVRAA
ncbi:hypothetical protein SAMN02745121_00462 [Nannocystis exedens]|uniref:Uncharacterized protein n=1 Tax=Nannocystis exedens TaxID=54 RepID=A0A1I1TCG7_9BACT|nr:hypothetical protein NAEX_09403 [Nannocystis exedens]SFD53160.1 hypothetical protein SAMN02745121_00462 [Nannocystis exedens]